MRFGSLCLFLSLTFAPPALAQTEEDGGFWERGAEALLRRLMEELDPAFGALREMLEEIDAYHPPEVLPNGDILIRRKTPPDRAPKEGAPEAPETPETPRDLPDPVEI